MVKSQFPIFRKLECLKIWHSFKTHFWSLYFGMYLMVSGKWTYPSYWTCKEMGKEGVRKMGRCSSKEFTGIFQSALEWGVLAHYAAVEDMASVQPQFPHWSYRLLDENEYLPGILPWPHLKCLSCFYRQCLSIRSRLTFPPFLGKKYISILLRDFYFSFCLLVLFLWFRRIVRSIKLSLF